MPFVLIAFGIFLAYLDWLGSNNLVEAGSLAKQEMFSGSDPFYKWAGAFILVGMIGYIPEMRPISTAFLILIILGIALAHNGAVNNLTKAL